MELNTTITINIKSIGTDDEIQNDISNTIKHFEETMLYIETIKSYSITNQDIAGGAVQGGIKYGKY